MANTLSGVFRNYLLSTSISRINKLGVLSDYAPGLRKLYAKATLGIPAFQEQRERIQHQMKNISDKFREKMSEYTSDDSKNMIFTEDLKNMIYISQDDKDIELVIKMMKRYNTQNKSLRFGNFIFGPVIMRLFYIHNKPELALECFKSDELSVSFDQLMSYQILLDLLYENKKYKEILEVANIIKAKQIEGSITPKNVVVLVLAACYKLKSKESFDYAIKLWSDLQNTGHQPMRRAVTFCAALALNQDRPDIALEVLSTCKNQNYTTIRNLKILALCSIGRIEEVIPILKSVLNEDTPSVISQVHTFNRDVIERIRESVKSSDNPEVALEFNRLEEVFKKQGNITENTLDDQLCSEIQQPPIRSNRDFVPRQQFQNRQQPNDSFQTRRPSYRRPGLADLV
ncbi:pentatricopeptide repeat-containing protein 2, mitochondrial-like [Sitophilus oryzae]|uniref:Pentatricopeptide repeat-containing protein 2, mitochondrial-like n=1 Tax=Sitophilus oryzae TaxID=7048 RepID=A0A6J2Y4T1_SITOR|nr:pentatricopeptide repeat-containing protein 2, mitochondrial-like [Sitophilus oryzae]